MRTPSFLQTRVERLERATDVAGIVALLSDRSEKTYERAHGSIVEVAGLLADGESGVRDALAALPRAPSGRSPAA